MKEDVWLLCRCETCNKLMMGLQQDITYTEENRRYLTCLYDGRHKKVNIIKKFDSFKECMGAPVGKYKRKKGRIKQD